MNEILLFIISVLPVFLIGMFIYKKDKEKEPTRLLVKLFLGGFLSCVLVLIIGGLLGILFPIFSEDTSKLNLLELFIHVFIGVALVEEFCKWIVAYKIAYNDSNFDEIYDGILYSVFVALGFACIENLLYVYEGGISTGISRALLAVPGHACDGLFMGYYLSLSKIATITHGIYDYCLFSKSGLLIILFFIFVVVMYIVALKRVKKVSSINKKFKYKDNYCPNCGHIVDSNYCPNCGRKNE